jgi:N utilization substance protein B
MANRHLSRSIVLQSLFEWDFTNRPDSEIESVFTRVAEEFAPGMGDFSFMRSLISNILKKRPDLDTIIEKAAPEWPIKKISIVDRNILRIGLYELLFSDRKEVPAKVAINEAIELAKTFGGETSGKFVNGVLGAVYKEMGEPGKDEKSTAKRRPFKNVPYDQMPIETLGGAVVYAVDDDGQVYLALVHDVFGHWTLSKGGLEAGENPRLGTVRKIKEEIGVDIDIKEELAKNEYIATHPEKGKIRKQVVYYLAETKFQDLKLKKTGGLDATQWFSLKDILDLNFYNDILPIITKAINLLLARNKSHA